MTKRAQWFAGLLGFELFWLVVQLVATLPGLLTWSVNGLVLVALIVISLRTPKS